MAYFVPFLVLFCSAIIGFNSRAKVINRVLFFLGIAMMVALAGLRSGTVGRDYLVYQDYFGLSPDTLGFGFFSQRSAFVPTVDVGYLYFSTLGKICGLGFEGWIFIVALVAVTGHALVFKKNSKFPALALLLYYVHAYFYREMTQIRAGLACMCILWAFHMFARKKNLQGYTLFMLGVSFHLASFIAIIPVIAVQMQWRPSNRFLILGFVSTMAVGHFVGASFPIFELIDRLSVYQGSEYAVALGVFSNPITVKQILIVIICAWLVKVHGFKSFSRYFWICYVSYVVSTLWIITFNQFQILGARGASFLSVGEPILLADIIGLFWGKAGLFRYRRIVSLGVLGMALSLFVINVYVKDLVFEYSSIFSN